jgi:hypothetical protein
MDKSDFLFLVSQQRQLQRKHPRGLRNNRKTLTLVRPPPFGTQTNAQVRRFNRSLLKAQGGGGGLSKKNSKKNSKKEKLLRTTSSTSSTSSTSHTNQRSHLRGSQSAGLLSTGTGTETTTTTTTTAGAAGTAGTAGTGTAGTAGGTDAVDALLREGDMGWSPITAYQHHIDTESGGDLEHLEHPFYDPVGRRSAPAFSLSGRPREPVPAEDELPEYVLERGPHGTYTRRRVGFLDVHEALKKMALNNPAFSIRGRLPETLPATHGGSSIGRAHTDWRGTKPDGTLAGHTFGVRHHHLDKVDGSQSVAPAPDAYDATQAFEALRRPGLKFQEVTMSIPLVDLVSKDIAAFPGPGSYTLPPAINTNFDVKTNRFRRTRGGYMPLRHRVGHPRTRPSEEELEQKAELYAARLCGRTPEALAQKKEAAVLKEKKRRQRVARNQRAQEVREEAERAALAKEAEKKEKARQAAEEKRRAAEAATAASSIY